MSEREKRYPNLRELYLGRSVAAVRFRFAQLVLDLVVIALFFLTTVIGTPTWVLVADLVFAALVGADIVARWLIASDRRKLALDPFTWADIAVLFSLLAPLVFGNFAYLRVLRALRILRSYHVLRELRRSNRFFEEHEEVLQRSLNLVVFIVIVSATVFVFQEGRNPGIANYLDAVYFTVTALTTTGFGDITLVGTSGRLLSIVILVGGVGLFLQLAQSIFRPKKVDFTCPGCGLTRHERDAVHCKHCGRELKIETEGA
ncbi:MAG: potassium channel family protein [Alphaproteobacteria bacterium]|nr:potassium channel family protein [Alphaproteobacteria bacterium]MDX5369604.1 potassium channel family protein [Alphaproteobacteria bacterium]MDX5464255.1 potassium channel family protein [Alphaproteobacteria bacterium]